MSDSKDTVASAARILELEHLLLSQGISLPSAHVKSKDDASDVSNMDLGSPQPAQGTMNAEVPDQGKAKVKSKMKGPLRRVKHGRQHTMDRRDRALCRILFDHGRTYQDIAQVVNQTVGIVSAAVKNNYVVPDDTDADYDFVDAQTKTSYPAKPPGKRLRDESSNEEPPPKQQKRIASVANSTTSAFTVEIPSGCHCASQASKKKPENNSMVKFLRDLDMEALFPKLQEAGMDDVFFVELNGWTEKAAGELLEDLVNAGIMNRIQAFKIRKALCRRQEGL